MIRAYPSTLATEHSVQSVVMSCHMRSILLEDIMTRLAISPNGGTMRPYRLSKRKLNVLLTSIMISPYLDQMANRYTLMGDLHLARILLMLEA